MHAHASGLVDYGDTLVFINHVERYVFRKCLQGRQFNFAGYDDFFPAAQLHGRLRCLPIDQDLFLLDELLDAHAAYVRKLRDKPLVQTHPSGLRRNRESLCWRSFCHAGIVVEGWRTRLSTRITLPASAVRTPTGVRSGPSRRTPSFRNPADKADAISSLPVTPSTPHTALSRCP